MEYVIRICGLEIEYNYYQIYNMSKISRIIIGGQANPFLSLQIVMNNPQIVNPQISMYV